MKTSEVCAEDINSANLSSCPFTVHQDIFYASNYSQSIMTPGAASQWRTQKRDKEYTEEVIAAVWSTATIYSGFLLRQKAQGGFSQNNSKTLDLQKWYICLKQLILFFKVCTARCFRNTMSMGRTCVLCLCVFPDQLNQKFNTSLESSKPMQDSREICVMFWEASESW